MRTAIVIALVLAVMSFRGYSRAAADQSVSFSRQIAPILLKQCQSCHGPVKTKGGYRLDTFTRLTQSGRSKHPPLKPGDPAASELFRLLVADDVDDRMPKDADPLPVAQVALIRQWIQQGATFDGPSGETPLAKLIRPVDHPPAPASYARPPSVAAICFDPAGDHLAVGARHEITFWKVADGSLVRRIGNVDRHTYALAFSPDGSRIAAASGQPGRSGEVRRFDPVSGKLIDVVLSADDVVLALAFSPDGRSLAAGGADNLLHLIDLATHKELLKINDHADWVVALSFSPDGKQIATASRDRTARLFDVPTGQGHPAYREHDAPVAGVAFGSDPQQPRCYSIGADRRLHRWKMGQESGGNKKTPAEILKLDADPLRMIATPAGLFIGCADGSILHVDPQSNKIVRTLKAHQDWVYALAYHPPTGRLAAGSHDGLITIWDAGQGKLIRRFQAVPKQG
jgi:WD40 repeat protein